MSLAIPVSANSPRRRTTPRRPSEARAAILDRKTLTERLAAVASQHAADKLAMRAAALDEFKSALERGRDAARMMLDADGRGYVCAANISWLEDEIIRALHEFILTHMAPAGRPGPADRIAICAVGGYGRGTLAPGSDIDLLFLLPGKESPWMKGVVEALLYFLWDLRQKVGHSTRSTDECLRQAREDMTVRTALLESRLILGDEPLFVEMRARFDKEIVAKTAREFVSAKLTERDTRVAKAGSSRYLVEPNIKEGKGGLRDLNTLFWISKYVYRVSSSDELVAAGVFTAREAQTFRRCEDFLWTVRCQLHFVSGRSEERLSFNYQREIARRLGYATHAGLSDVERFMKHYFLVAKDVGDLTAIVCAALEERETKSRPVLDRFMGRLRRSKRSLEFNDFTIENDRVTVAAPDAFDRDPVNLMRLYWLANKHGLAIHPDAMRLVTLSLKRIDAATRSSPEANRLFLDILISRNSPETVLRLMNEAGVLGRFIPDFGRIVAMMQFNMYHHYTVDEHLIRCIGILAQIDAGTLADEHPLASKILPGIANRRSLYVAMLLHDIAKGRPEDHSVAGAEVARKLCPRFGLTPAETDTVAWLVLHHLDMSNTAQSRDLADPVTISNFAKTVQTLERLKLLLILTVCDIRGVGPGVWNGWKGQLLRTLYYETELVISGGHTAVNRKQRVLHAQDELRKALPGWSDPEFDAYALRHYPAYWLKVDLAHKIRHAGLLRLTEVELRSLATEVTTDAFTGITQITVVAPDHPRMLSIITGACAAAGANIADAQIYTTTDGLALDTISVNRAFDRDEDEQRRAQRIADTIEKALRGEIRIAAVVAEKEKPSRGREKTFLLAPEVTLDNSLSDRYTVIEVSGLDRPGLLYDLTSAISRLNLNIGSAHIVTFGEKAVDAFYVTDLTGLKITNSSRQAAIRKALLDVFGVEPDAGARVQAISMRPGSSEH
jgi:[protein-PII] uridylyltransferase